MEKAIRIERGRETLVSASEIQTEFRGRYPRGSRFVCPLCRQLLFPAAMSLNGKQSPHFRHERNNERAKECELFAKTYGYASIYQRAPLPMFIRRSRSKDAEFIVEGGFRYLGADVVAQLEGEGAVLHMGARQYRINENNFGSGFPKKIFEELALCMEPIFELKNSSLSLNETWGCPEDARHAIVFTCDPYSQQGKRIKLGDLIPYETELYLLIPTVECNAVKKAFPGSKRIGFAGLPCQGKRLEVHAATFSKNDANWEAGAGYLKECGFEVGKKESDPDLVWPPALTSAGAAELLLKDSECIIVADRKQAADLQLRESSESVESAKTHRLLFKTAADYQSSFAKIRPSSELCFVTTKEWSEAGLTILSSQDSSLLQIDGNTPEVPSLQKAVDGKLAVFATAPCSIIAMRSGGAERSESKIYTAEQLPFAIDRKRYDLLRVTTKLRESKDDLVVAERQFNKAACKNDPAQRAGGRAALLALQSADLTRAINRRNGDIMSTSHVKDRGRALIRKGLR